MEKLFTEFGKVDYETWINQIKKDLKDKSIETLTSKPERDLEIKAYYHPEHDRFAETEFDATNYYQRKSNNWAIRATYSKNSNAQILKDLNEGIDAVSIPALSEEQLKADTREILFEHIQSDFVIENPEMAEKAIYPRGADLNFDILGRSAEAGKILYNPEIFVSFFDKQTHNRSIWVTGSRYGNAGSTTIQELAFTLAHLNEYLQLLHDAKKDLKEIGNKIVVELSVGSNYFLNVARFRAFRQLFSMLCQGYGSENTESFPKIYATTSPVYYAQNDRNNNFLRQTTQAMSAILGGCDVLTIETLPGLNAEETTRNKRMASSIQLVLREESYLDKVLDPAAGSMFLESLTDQIVSKAWQLFLDLENQGGYLQCLAKNVLQDLIRENREDLVRSINSGEQIFLGVNKYPNNLEKWIPTEPVSASAKADFEAILPFRIENHFQLKTTVS